MQSSWHQHLTKAVAQRPTGTTFAAFNLNIDVVAKATPASVEQLVRDTPDIDWDRVRKIDVETLRTIDTKEQFIAVMQYGFRTGKSALLVREHEDFVDWWQQLFPDREESMGGQAGIIANQMAALGARSVVYSPLRSPKQAALFLPGVQWPEAADQSVTFTEASDAGREGDLTREPWVFEYRQGDTYTFPDGTITTPRANRAIITTGIQGPERRFHDDIASALPALGAHVDVGFMAGYHQCGDNPDQPEAVRAYIKRSVQDLKALRSQNPELKLHVEYVPAKVKHMERELYQSLCTQIDSFGINETEIRSLLTQFDRDDLARELAAQERAYPLYQGALVLLNELGVERVHVHNLGYYVVVIKKPYSRTPQAVRDACLFASAVNARKAQQGGYVAIDSVEQAADIPLSPVGFEQLESFAKEALAGRPAGEIDLFLQEGIFEADDHTALVIPAHVVPNPVVTVGMGDTISSSAYVYEVCPKVRAS